ncbi:aromatic ring-hydroxylating oxygenase subunit alpha [Miniphocaeibacter massiliensis]|uniref:aromatic ring-hydroxylating oxygenase subunit alpha n=1 Tax=Miniphocaeibacter massiliensis TaxID=2041841 RepID=UPI000C1C4B35|nr:aromatic ring-hydroxylating dioxygenase subunit alpha [Miniphocaeibacter massiliensis]
MILNQWYAIASSKEVKNDKVLGLKRLNLELVLYRENGKVKVLEDKCCHRGAALSKGKKVNNCIQCPFHGIEFAGDGSSKYIPAEGKAFQKSLNRFKVKSYQVVEQDGIIFIWYGDEEPTIQPPHFEVIRNSNLKMKEKTDVWNAHYSRVIENQLDTIHLPFVHHNTIGRGNKTLVNGPKVTWIDENTLQTSANNDLDNGQQPLKPEESIIKDTNLTFKYPNIWLNHVSDKILIMIFFAPIDDSNTKLYLRFYNSITGIGIVDSIISWFGKFANNIVQKQDKRVVITQKPKASGLKVGEKLLVGDKPIIEYRKRREELKNIKKNDIES